MEPCPPLQGLLLTRQPRCPSPHISNRLCTTYLSRAVSKSPKLRFTLTKSRQTGLCMSKSPGGIRQQPESPAHPAQQACSRLATP
ncbi:hypothetical protein VTI28DRAFT_3880 [Corynascus sepedonium]